MAVKIHKPRARPVLLLNCYLPASNAAKAADTAAAAFEWAASIGEQWGMIGDFNLTKEHWPMGAALATGLLFDMDDVAGPHALQGTHRNHAGELTGRVIDFMLATNEFFPVSRVQHQSVADHDLILYDFPWKDDVTQFSWPARPSLRLEKVSSEQWANVWNAFSSTFDTALEARDSDAAWQALSSAAETALGGTPEAPNARHNQLLPTVKKVITSTKAPNSQSLLERQLRRLARKAQQSLLQPNDVKLKRNFFFLIDFLSDQVPLLTQCQWNSEATVRFLFDLADQEAKAAARQRIHDWKDQISDDVPRLARWIKARSELDDSGSWCSDSPHSQLQAEKCARSWFNLWNPETLPVDQALDQFLEFTPACPNPWPLPSLQGHQLQHLCHQAIKKAPGLDCWLAKSWDCLPLDFFDKLANLWNSCLQGATLPQQWKHVRIALIPKNDGGMRPLAIAVMAWRLGMAAVMRELRQWTLSWLSPELCGGVAEKSIHDVHAHLFSDLQTCRGRAAHFAGCKADVRKCFDSVQVSTAIRIWKHLGAPPGVLSVLNDFYQNQSRWFSIRNCVAPTPVTARRSVLQGCPASPALLNGLMTVWVNAIKVRVPSVRLAVYLDDRTIWATDRMAAANVHEAMLCAESLDEALGFALHPDKLESFALKAGDRQYLNDRALTVGPAKVSFKLLGIQYFVGSHFKCHKDHKLHKTLVSRCRKIRMVTRNLNMRRQLVHILVVAMLRWMGPWQRFHKGTLKGWARAIETAIWGYCTPPGRSGYLFWTAIAGLRCHLECALSTEAIMYEWRRQVNLFLGKCTVTRASPRAIDTFNLLHWKKLQNDVWQTPFGQIRVGWISDSDLAKLVRLSWTRVLFQSDTKTQEHLPDHLNPYFGFHNAMIKECGERYKMTVLMAAASDGRILERMGAPEVCACGINSPDREHLTFHCNADTAEKPVLKTHNETRLLQPLVPLPNTPIISALTANVELVQCLRQLYAVDHSPVVLALDGSCLVNPGNDLYQWASWGIVTSTKLSFNGLLTGCVHTPAAAEREALVQAMLAAHSAAVPVRCSSTMRQLSSASSEDCVLATGTAMLPVSGPISPCLPLMVWK